MVLDSDRRSAGAYRCDRRDSLGQQWKPTGRVVPHNLLDIGCATLHAATIGGVPALEAGSYDASPWVDINRWQNRSRTRDVACSPAGSRDGVEPAPPATHRRSLRSTALVRREHRPTRRHHSLVLGHCPRPSPDRGRTLLPDHRSSWPGQPGHHHPPAGPPWCRMPLTADDERHCQTSGAVSFTDIKIDGRGQSWPRCGFWPTPTACSSWAAGGGKNVYGQRFRPKLSGFGGAGECRFGDTGGSGTEWCKGCSVGPPRDWKTNCEICKRLPR
jgi:hypothetical protein